MNKIPDPLLVSIMKDSDPTSQLTLTTPGQVPVSMVSPKFLEGYESALQGAKQAGAKRMIEHVGDILYEMESKGLIDILFETEPERKAYRIAMLSIVEAGGVALERDLIDFSD